MARTKFTDYLIEAKLISQEDLDDALRIQKEKNISLVEVLVKLGYIQEKRVLNALASYLRMPPIRVLNLNISKEILSLVPEHIAQRYNVLPIGKMGNSLTLAMADPLDILVKDDLKKITKCEINAVVALFSEIQQAISAYYTKISKESLEEIVKEQDLQDLEVLKDAGDVVSAEEITQLKEDAPVIKFSNYLFGRAVNDKASDILIEPMEHKSRVRFRIDGVLREIETFPKKIHPFVVSRVKVMSNLNISEHRLPQEGRFRSRIMNREIDFRVSILPASLGEKVVLRVLDKNTALLDLDLLGFEEPVLKKIKEDSFNPHGLILVCGPTGSGKTTTLYSIINHIYTPQKNIVTVEDPIEYQLKGINQVSINPAIKLTFSKCLRSILRQDPDIIMIGEIRDAETADIAIKSALTGHLVLSTLHTTTSAASITRLINMGVEPFLLSSTLIGILTQRLVRKLCPRCKEELTLSDTVIDKYLIKKDAKTYRLKGCDDCRKAGYKGRVALGEYLAVSLNMRTMINNAVTEQALKVAARREGMTTLREDGIIKLEKGATTLEEVLKVTALDEPIK